MQITLAHIDKELSASGLLSLGAFHPQVDDGVPGWADDCSLVLVGNAGPEMWRAFSTSDQDADDADPLDSWSRKVLTGLCQELSGRFSIATQALFPFDGPPYYPFQRWALRAGSVHPSPIGPLIHDTYGLWHAYRGALLIPAKIKLAPPQTSLSPSVSPCQSCRERPCLTTCPAGAFSEDGYNVPACLDLLESEPDGPCLSASCLARRACPVGREFIYEPAHAQFHMDKFLIAHRG